MKLKTREIAEELILRLWNGYLLRVPYPNTYNSILQQNEEQFVPDHLAFRTLNAHSGEQPEGIQAIRHIFDCLEFRKTATYKFRKKKLTAIHLEHPDGNLPKIFISQLEVNELPPWAQEAIAVEINEAPYRLPDTGIELLNRLKAEQELTAEAASVLLENLVQYFKRPWNAPSKDTVLKLNDISQYAAWVLLHGNQVSHFAGLVNKKQLNDKPDLKSVVESMKMAGVPMKETIEGEKDGKLRQAATLAVKEEVEVKGDDGIEKIPWTYAYFELVQRKFIKENGEPQLFPGFIENQERHLFGMTVTHEN